MAATLRCVRDRGNRSGDSGIVGGVGTETASDVTGTERSVDGWDVIAALYRVEQPGLVRLAHLLVRDAAVAEELVQEAFLRLHPHLEGTDKPGAYLRTTVVNLCRAHHRRAGVAERHAPQPSAAAAPPALPADLSATWIALGDLPERQRQALVLRFYLDLPDDEIANLLDAKPGTVRSLVSTDRGAMTDDPTGAAADATADRVRRTLAAAAPTDTHVAAGLDDLRRRLGGATVVPLAPQLGHHVGEPSGGAGAPRVLSRLLLRSGRWFEGPRRHCRAAHRPR